MVVGFAGLLLVAVPGGGGSGAWLSILAAVAITAGALLARRLGALDIVQAAGWHFVTGGALLAIWPGPSRACLGSSGRPRSWRLQRSWRWWAQR